MKRAATFIFCCSLLALPLMQAQSQELGTKVSSRRLCYNSKMIKLLPNSTVAKGVLKFAVNDCFVMALMDAPDNEIKVIYLFPKSARSSHRKDELQQSAKALCQLLLPNQPQPDVAIPQDGSFAQILIDNAAPARGRVLASSTCKAVRKLIQDYGAPVTLYKGRLIWQIPCNDNRTRLEVAIDLQQAVVESLDLYIQGGVLSDAALLKLMKDEFDVSLRPPQASNESERWGAYTSMPARQIIGAYLRPAASCSPNTYFLIRESKIGRLAKADVLRKANRDKITWLQSEMPHFPLQNVPLNDAERKTRPQLSPINLETPGVILERYIKRLSEM